MSCRYATDKHSQTCDLNKMYYEESKYIFRSSDNASRIVFPSLATYAILTLLEAGESVSETFSLTNTVFMHFAEHNHCLMHVLASGRAPPSDPVNPVTAT